MPQIARSPRHPSDLRAVLVDGDVQSAGRVVDVSSSGLLVQGPVGLRIGRRLTVVGVDDAREGAARAAQVVRQEGRDCAGLRFLADAWDKRPADDGAPQLYLAEAWDTEGEWLAPLPGPAAPCARFAVRPPTVDRLRRFADRDLAAGRTVLFTNELRAAGDRVAVVLVHPLTGAELDLPAAVVRTTPDKPSRLELAFLATDVESRIEVARFVETGDPHPRLLLPVPNVELENDRLRARVAELEEALEEAERTERMIMRKLQEQERGN